jgi:hypothetical protein
MITSTLTLARGDGCYEVEVRESSGPGTEARHVAGGRLPDPLPPLGPYADPVTSLPQLLVSEGDLPVDPQETGVYLYRLLADNGLADWLEDVRRGRPGPRSVLLHLADPGLRRVPWELLIDPQSFWAPFLDPVSSWVRVTATLESLPPLTPPVRVLFVAGAYEDVKLYADDELDAIIRALCRQPADFHVEYVVAPTSERFESVYEDLRPHVLHVVAHGTRSGAHTVLSMRDGLEGAWKLTQMKVANGLLSCPRLVVLNACRSGVGSAAADAAWGFTELFLDKGAGAVVSMQGDIPAKAGIAFTEAFYARLAAGQHPDVAAQEGRREAFAVSEAAEVWSLPTLTLRAQACDVLATRSGRPAPARLAAVTEESVTCVDRAPERRRLWDRAVPEEPGRPPRLIVVTGGDGTGKSAVVKGALPACHARGCDIAYVDFGPSTRLAWFSAVRRVHDHLLEWLPEHAEAIRRFEHCAESFRTAPYIDHDAPVLRTFTPGGSFENEADLGENRKRAIFRDLCRLVEDLASANKLLLVLDHLATGLTDEARDEYILPRMVQPLLDDTTSDVVVVAVVPKDYTLAVTVPGDAVAVEVPAFEKPAFELLLREYLARRCPAGLLPEQKQRVRLLAAFKESWDVADLNILGRAAEL